MIGSRGRSLVVEPQPSKLMVRVRFPLSAGHLTFEGFFVCPIQDIV